MAEVLENSVTSGDANDFTAFGFYNFSLDVINTPFNYGIILAIPAKTSGIKMCFHLAVERNTISTPKVAYRTFRDSEEYGWSVWKII